MAYVVTATRKGTGQKVNSNVYATRAEAEAHQRNSQAQWRGMFTNFRIKKVK